MLSVNGQTHFEYKMHRHASPDLNGCCFFFFPPPRCCQADRKTVKLLKRKKATLNWAKQGFSLDAWCTIRQVLPDWRHRHRVGKNLEENAVFCALSTWQFIQRLHGFEGSLWRLFVQIRPDSDCHRAPAAQPLMQTDRCREAADLSHLHCVWP